MKRYPAIASRRSRASSAAFTTCAITPPVQATLTFPLRQKWSSTTVPPAATIR